MDKGGRIGEKGIKKCKLYPINYQKIINKIKIFCNFFGKRLAQNKKTL